MHKRTCESMDIICVLNSPSLVYRGGGIIRYKLILFFILLQMGFKHGAAMKEDFQSYSTNKRS
jgi:hypothetical protein